MDPRDDGIPTFKSLPGNIYFRHQDLAPAAWIPHSHPWGQLNYVSQGLMHLEITGERFLSPPHYAVWIPPGLEHVSFNDAKAVYRTVYVSEEFSMRLPNRPCSLAVGPLLKALLNEFADLDVRMPRTAIELSMAEVVLHQIENALPLDTYLPYASSDALNLILDEVRARPADKRTAERIARDHHMTARTFERRCRSELGISFGEWRQRMRFMQAVDALEAGETIQRIAHKLGYATSSAFIGMFRRQCGRTPEQYRRLR